MSEARVFLSYPRGEKDAVFAAALKAAIERTAFDANRYDADLVANIPGLPITLPDGPPIEVWRDINHLRGGDGWWSQIEAVLKSERLDHLVLVVTPRTFESDIIRRELHYARSCGKQISPIKGPDYVLKGVPRWLGQVYDLDIPEQAALFVETIKAPSRAKPVLRDAPPLRGFIERPMEFAEIKAALLDRAIDKDVGITALKGGGGYGKTMLATALLRDLDIQDAFDDGIAWVTIGREQSDLLPKITSLIGRLTGKRGESTDLEMAGQELASALGHRRILLVIDDVWRRRDVEPFLVGGPNARRLITTRNNSALPTDIEPIFVDQMQPGDAKRLLTRGFETADVAIHAKSFEDLEVPFGGWAQGLAIVNGYLREQCKRRMPLANALSKTIDAVKAQGLAALEPFEKSDHTQTVSRTVELSLSLLDAASRERFLEFAIFPEDVDIPIGMIEAWWRARHGLSAQAVEKFLIYLDDLSLLQQIDLEKQTIKLHDNIVDELRRLAVLNLPRWHRDFLSVLHGASADAYRYKFTPFHLHEAGELDALDRLLLNPDWIGGKLRALGAQELAADYRDPPGYGSLRAHRLLGRTLNVCAGILSRDPRQLEAQLYGRLMSIDDPHLRAFTSAVKTRSCPRGLMPARPSLDPAGAETARLEGHGNWISALAILPDGRLASGSQDKTIRLWNVSTGTEIAQFKGHGSEIRALAVLQDGRLASGSNDRSIRLWDLSIGAETARLEGHGGGVLALAVLPDGRLASGCYDGTIRLWDVSTGAEIARLEGHGSMIRALAVLPDGRLASGAYD